MSMGKEPKSPKTRLRDIKAALKRQEAKAAAASTSKTADEDLEALAFPSSDDESDGDGMVDLDDF